MPAHIGKLTNPMMSGLICECGHDYVSHGASAEHKTPSECMHCVCNRTRAMIVGDFVKEYWKELDELRGELSDSEDSIIKLVARELEQRARAENAEEQLEMLKDIYGVSDIEQKMISALGRCCSTTIARKDE